MERSNGRLERALRDLILKREFATLPFKQQLEFLCKSICREIEVARAGVWRFIDNDTAIISEAEWDADRNALTEGTVLRQEDASAYLDALKEEVVLALDDAINDPRCAELAKTYLPTYGISSMLDCPLHDADGLIGVLCVEHVGEQRVWTEDERTFAMAITSLAALCFEGQARREAETAKADREQRLKQFAEMSMGWMFDLDASLALTNVIGDQPIEYPYRDLLIGKQPWDFEEVYPMNSSWDEVRSKLEEHKPLNDVILISPVEDGERAYTEISARPEYDSQGNFTGYIGAAKDVSQRIANQIELRASEQRYQSASRLGRFGSWIWDEIEECASYCSPELAEIYGVTVEEYLEQSRSVGSDLEWFHPDDRERYERVTRDAVENETGYEITARIVRRDGTIRHLHEWTEPVFDDAGRFVATAGVLLDITERVQLQERFRTNTERLRSLVDNLPGAVFRVGDEEGWPTKYLSRGYYRTFIDPSGGAIDASGIYPEAAMRIDTAFEDRVYHARRQSIDKNRPYEVEYRIAVDGADPKWVWERGRPVVSSEGLVELQGLLLDITDRRSVQEALTKAQRLEAVGQLTGGIAHDFNNLLAIILGNLEIVKLQTTPPDIIDMLNDCINATERGAELTRSMLAFSRRADLQPRDIELNEVIEESRAWIGRTLPANIRVSTKLSADIWGIKADLAGTETALLNLILNARDAMPDGGILTIESENAVFGEDNKLPQGLAPGNYVVLSVTDTGTGIARESLSKIFEPFHTTKEPGANSGLGLSMVQGFMEQSGGQVAVASELGTGTTFRLYFPRSESALERTTEKAASEPIKAARSAKLLLVEDEPAVLKVLRLTLESAGYNVVGTGTAKDALRVFRSADDFDLVITDVVLPGGMLGPELAKEIRATRPDVPIIFVSGYPDRPTAPAPAPMDNEVRLVKPVKSADLFASIEQLLPGGA